MITVESLRSDPLVHRFGELFNPPGLTNFLGCVQSDVDVVGIRSLNFPPFSNSDSVTAGLYVDGRYFPSTGAPITYVWRPDRIERSAEFRGFRLSSTTVLPVGRMAALVVLEVENVSGADRDLHLRLSLKSTLTRSVDSWKEPYPPSEPENAIGFAGDRSALTFASIESEAWSVQGCWPRPERIELNGMAFRERLAPGEVWRMAFVNAIGPTLDEALATYDAVMADPRAEVDKARRDWNAELRAVFTPGNDRYSGSLPWLDTDDDDIRHLYLAGILGVVMFKRDSPYSVVGRAYDTLMPRYWQGLTFLWDYCLSSVVHSLLDPAVQRKYLRHWMSTDVHTHMGTHWLTGRGVGEWYSVNDGAMVRMLHDYVRWTGDRSFLDEQVESVHGTEQRVVDYLLEYARAWERFRTANGLADYGGIANLLECVSTYVHEVASMNAANVYGLRAAAEVLTAIGETAESDRLRAEAANLVNEVLKLYAEGEGHWNTRFPDGWLLPVRHAYDFATILNTIPGDLSDAQQREMTRFFQRELMTPSWMHALSCADPDATFTVRPDHQWTGAYIAWPSESAAGLFNIGQGDLAFRWMKGLAATANQGPFGQAHFAESVIPPDSGGARKAAPDLPWICDWACSAGGSWARLIIESLFGVKATVADGLHATPNLGAFDGDARLVNLAHQGRLYTVDRDGAHEQPGPA